MSSSLTAPPMRSGLHYYLEQQFNIAINNITSLSSTTLEITDYSRIEKGKAPLVFSFANNAFPPPFPATKTPSEDPGDHFEILSFPCSAT